MSTYAYIAAALSAVMAIIFIYKSYKGTPKEKLFSKSVASLLFLVAAIFGLLTPTAGADIPGYGTLLLLGLIFGFVGDVLLETQAVVPEKQKLFFVSGLGSFLLGHVFYIILLAKLASFSWLHIVLALALFALIMWLKTLTKSDPGKMMVPVIAYAAIISVMVGFAVGAYFAAPGKLTFTVLIAALMFLVSDVLLAYIYFGPKTVKPLRACNLSFYYAAQITLALSMLIR